MTVRDFDFRPAWERELDRAVIALSWLLGSLMQWGAVAAGAGAWVVPLIGALIFAMRMTASAWLCREWHKRRKHETPASVAS